MGATDTESGDAGFQSSADAMARLQMLADALSRVALPAPFGITLQVIYIAGTANPWRLVESWPVSPSGRRRRRMLCFASLERIRRSIQEHLAWQEADARFVETNMTTPGGFPGITTDWVSSSQFDRMFTPEREAMRAQRCQTQPEQIVMFS